MVHALQTAPINHDADLERRIVALLDGYHIPSLRKLRVEARDRAITVSGEVNTFYAKQILQHAVQRLGGDYQVDNQVRVSTARPVAGPGRSSTQALSTDVARSVNSRVVTSIANGLETVLVKISR